MPAPDDDHGLRVLLLAPELLGPEPDLIGLRWTLAQSGGSLRVLARVIDGRGIAALQLTASMPGIRLEILAAAGLALPDMARASKVVHMPPGVGAAETDDLALALSDVVLVAGSERDLPLAKKASGLGKPLLAPGHRVPQAEGPFPGLLDDLDADTHPVRRRVCGRSEQFALQMLAIKWTGRWTQWKDSLTRIGRCFATGWEPVSFLGPEGWEKYVPDRDAATPDAPIVARFALFDRCAVYGAYVHRDCIWAINALAVVAVFAAVIGAIWGPPHGHASTLVELVALLAIGGLVLTMPRFDLHPRWTASRMAAEQSRVARLCVPLLVAPEALLTKDGPVPSGWRSNYTWLALDGVKRSVRRQGLPRIAGMLTPRRAAEWLQLIVVDQIGYHHRNAATLTRAEHCLEIIVATMFLATFGVVLAHFKFDAHWMLLVTAGGPALAAASHGAKTQLGFVHRIALSEETVLSLDVIAKELEALLGKEQADTAEYWSKLRGLAVSAAQVMGQENLSWHHLLQRERASLP